MNKFGQIWIKERLKTSFPELSKKYSVNKIALFGSVLRDDFNEQSDFDILVDFDSDDFDQYLQLADELEFILKRKIDLLTFRSLKPRHFEYLRNKLLYV
jgi:uncharacterized protein